MTLPRRYAARRATARGAVHQPDDEVLRPWREDNRFGFGGQPLDRSQNWLVDPQVRQNSSPLRAPIEIQADDHIITAADPLPDDRQLTLFEATGLALQDLAAAEFAAQTGEKRGAGIIVQLD